MGKEAGLVFHELCEGTFYRALRPYIYNWIMSYFDVRRKQQASLEVIYETITSRMITRISRASTKIQNLPNKRLTVLDLLLVGKRSELIDELVSERKLEI